MIAKGSENIDTKLDIDPAGRIQIASKQPLGHPGPRHQTVRRQGFDASFGEIVGYHAKEGIVAAPHHLCKKRHCGGIGFQFSK